MNDVAIIGAGELGGSLAHVLARGNVARAIRLIDETGQVAAGKALDIAQAGPVENFSTELSGLPAIASDHAASFVLRLDHTPWATDATNYESPATTWSATSFGHATYRNLVGINAVSTPSAAIAARDMKLRSSCQMQALKPWTRPGSGSASRTNTNSSSAVSFQNSRLKP